MKCFKTILLLLFILKSNSQTILNTEKLLSEVDSTFVTAISFEGDFQSGNIDLVDAGLSIMIGKKVDRSIYRLIIGYQHQSEDNEVLSNDISGQLRYNYTINKNSIFSFLQFQNAKSLLMKHRYLIGLGYRQNIFLKNGQYMDLSYGLFHENELYNNDLGDVKVNNLRHSISLFFKVDLEENIFLNNSLYLQYNTSDLKDYRSYIEPRIYFEFEKFNMYLSSKNRFHSKPYVDIKRSDNEILVGFEIGLN